MSIASDYTTALFVALLYPVPRITRIVTVSEHTPLTRILVYNWTLKTAFELGCAQIDLENLDE
jgi:hypothetical protein